jgi:mono/diheme cytochrome c family protein
MKKSIKITGVIIGTFLLLLVVFGSYIHLADTPTYASVKVSEIQVKVDSQRIALGQKLVESNCAGCHKSKAGKFEGTYVDDPDAAALGSIYSSNITQHPKYGIGAYTDGELYRLLRTGVKKNNNLMLPIMPLWVNCSDEDIYAMIAYLKSDHKAVQAVATDHPDYEPTFLAKALMKFAFRPTPYRSSYPERPAPTHTVALGEYLVEGDYLCYFCHSGNIAEANLLAPKESPNYLGGGTVFSLPDASKLVVPSLRMDGESAISTWSYEEFHQALKYGITPDGEVWQEPMKPYTLLDSTETQAIYAYLSTQMGE